MNRLVAALALALLWGAIGTGAGCTARDATADATRPELERFRFVGTCDASAIIALGRDRFLVADDEDNLIRLCEASAAPRCTTALDLAEALRRAPDSEPEEADFEGAARVGDRIYWVASHGRSKGGERRADRYNLVATRIEVEVGRDSSHVRLVPEGSAYRGLAGAIESAPAFAALGLATALALDEAHVRALAPKRGGFNIEGLAARPGGGLLIGLRNPPGPAGAIVLPLENPAALIERGAAPRFGAAWQLDLAGRTIRSLELDPSTGDLLVVGGAIDDEIEAALYVRHASDGLTRPHLASAALGLADLNPEGLARTPDGGWLWIVSDDGRVEDAHGVKCKRQPEAADRSFRALRVALEPVASKSRGR